MKEKNKGEKILLALLPFWDPQIPPLGLACLKSVLQQNGCTVKTVDANLEIQFRNIFDNYFKLLQKYVPKSKQGNIFNIGNQVLRNHLTAHIHYEDKSKYIELVKILVQKTFFCDFPEDAFREMIDLVEHFYAGLGDYFLQLLENEKPTVLGLSVFGDTFGPSLYAFQLTRKHFPGIRTVMGGGIFADQLAPGSPELDYFVRRTDNYIDKIIIGEGEGLFLSYLRGELEGTPKVVSLRDRPEAILDIASVEVPDFSDFQLQFYPHIAHYGARSCPFQCRFCSETINWGRYRKKDVSQTVREFIELYRRFHYQLFLLTDSTLNPIATDLAREIIRSGVPIYWDGFLRGDKHVCDSENTLLWRQGGFYRAKLGLESGSQRVLDLMDKRITVEQSEAALTSLAYAGIKTTTFWLFGFPGETGEDFQETLDFLERNKDNIYEADCNAFNYYLTGQANSGEWQENNKGVLLYPGWAREMVITQTWILDEKPSREEAYKRLNRFIEHCDRLGIPNPYSLKDVFKADERWKKLHKNAVPLLVDLKNPDITIDECKNVKRFTFVRSTFEDEEDWL